jgi:UDP-N-acetylmuramoylalanine--D-glutamate ligase
VNLVFGCGLSGLAAIKLLVAHQLSVVATDDRPLSPEAKKLLESLQITFCLASDLPAPALFSRIIVSPGLPFSHPWIEQARAASILILSEIDLALSYYPHEIICVTGTNGKSTAVMMIEHLLRKNGFPAQVSGNIGIPLSEVVLQNPLPRPLVVELSSYQLHWSHRIDSRIGVFYNFAFDHMGQHQTEENYFLAKLRLFDSNHPDFLALISPEIETFCEKFHTPLPCKNERVLRIDPSNIPAAFFEEGGLQETHNRINATFAAMACEKFLPHPPSLQTLLSQLKDFTYLPHRFEWVGKAGTSPIINDSKSTTLASTLSALENVHLPCILFLGGRGKGESFAPLSMYQEKLALVYTFGESGNAIADTLPPCPVERHATLQETLASFVEKPIPQGHVILFSPGCASQDEFTDFAARGRFFVEQLRPHLTEGKSTHGNQKPTHPTR